MQINMLNLKCECSEETKSYILKKLKRLEKYFNDDINAKVVTKNEGKKKKIEVTIPCKNFIIRSEETREELEEAIDIVIDKIERQIRKNKTRMQKKITKTKLIDINLDNDEENVDEENNITKRKVIDAKPMNEEEAILQMNLLNHDFYMFKNVNTGSNSIVYKRKDGDYGLIDSK